MSLSRIIIECLTGIAARILTRKPTVPSLERIFVLRNNDLGDVLVITPLLAAIKQAFPHCWLAVGIGSWAVDILKNNPWVDEVIIIDAPWHNKYTSQGTGRLSYYLKGLQYIRTSPQVTLLKQKAFTIGIDVLGSPQGSWLMLKAGIPYRLGMRGYAGGHSACNRYVEYSPNQTVSALALAFVQLLGPKPMLSTHPQLFLTVAEHTSAEALWAQAVPKSLSHTKPLKIVVGIGGGLLEKCWPLESFIELVRLILAYKPACVLFVGNEQDRIRLAHVSTLSDTIQNVCGQLSLRDTFAVVAQADLVICNSSMLFHCAVAFGRKIAWMLGPVFEAETHDQQWGYPDATYLTFGKRPKVHPDMYAPQEVFDWLQHNDWLQ